MSFSCPLRFLLRGSGFLFGAVLAVPSVPQGCLRASLGVPLRTARGTQKGPPYRRDLLFLGSLWGPLGCSVGSRTLFFWPILLISSRWAYEVAPQEFAWLVLSLSLSLSLSLCLFLFRSVPHAHKTLYIYVLPVPVTSSFPFVVSSDGKRVAISKRSDPYRWDHYPIGVGCGEGKGVCNIAP